jgi:argininosuccinate lyase
VRRRWPARVFRSTAHQTAKALGFREPTRNSIDTVSDRDFALEFMAAGLDLRHPPVTLGRGDRHLVDAAIRIRHACRTRFPPARRSCRRRRTRMRPNWSAPRPAASMATLIALLTTMKGLPLAYSKDMQEDKEQVFDAAESLELAQSQP